jgi:hypothetical protein
MAGSQTRISTGQLAFDGGINSDRVPTIASQNNPNGLQPNMLAWAVNASVRGGGIYPRRGIKYIGTIRGQGLFQEASMYTPLTGLPYIMANISGRTYQVRVDQAGMPVVDVSIAGDLESTTAPLNWMKQGERFLVIQDNVHLPLFWDGTALRRSTGASVVYAIVGVATTAPAIGQLVDVTLTTAYAGPSGQKVYVNGDATKAYQIQSNANFVTLQNTNFFTVGTTVPAGTELKLSNGTVVGITLAPFIIPAITASIQVALTAPFSGSVGNSVRYEQGGGYPPAYFFLVTAVGTAPPAANHVFLVNLNQPVGGAIPINATLSSLAELPAAQAMDYYMGRLWLARGREYMAGDIVGSPATPTSGSPEYGYTDSILHNTENSYLSIGGTFLVPTQAGDIRALSHPANLDTALGEGQLLALTRNTIYSVNVVPQRAAWALLSEPIQRVVQITFGATGHRCLVQVNGDLFYQSIDGIRSLIQAIRYFQQLGNTALSAAESRAIDLNDRELLLYASGVEFDQRLFQTCLPEQIGEGVIHKGIIPLDFNPVSNMGQTGQPVWEGMYQGLEWLQLLQADYDGKQRMFAIVRSSIDASIEVWEHTRDELFDTNKEGEARIRWSFETPSYTWGREFDLKTLDTMELWIDQLYDTVDFTVEFRPGSAPCWYYWHHWQICSPRDVCELPGNTLPCVYPQQPYKKQYRSMMTLPKPPSVCNASNGNERPINVDYSFQFRITIHGYCRVRGLVVHAFEKDRAPYSGITC